MAWYAWYILLCSIPSGLNEARLPTSFLTSLTKESFSNTRNNWKWTLICVSWLRKSSHSSHSGTTCCTIALHRLDIPMPIHDKHQQDVRCTSDWYRLILLDTLPLDWIGLALSSTVAPIWLQLQHHFLDNVRGGASTANDLCFTKCDHFLPILVPILDHELFTVCHNFWASFLAPSVIPSSPS